MSKTNVILTIPEPGVFDLIERPYPQIKAGYAIIKNEIESVALRGRVSGQSMISSFMTIPLIWVMKVSGLS